MDAQRSRRASGTGAKDKKMSAYKQVVEYKAVIKSQYGASNIALSLGKSSAGLFGWYGKSGGLFSIIKECKTELEAVNLGRKIYGADFFKVTTKQKTVYLP